MWPRPVAGMTPLILPKWKANSVSPEEHKRLAQSVRHFIWWNTYGYSMGSPFARAELQVSIDDFAIRRVTDLEIVNPTARRHAQAARS